jgi:type I restriction enzyme M protein
MKNNVAYADLVDMLTFDRENFDKNISLAVKKKVKIESKWELVRLEDISNFIKRGKSAKYGNSNIQIIKSGQARGIKEFDFSQQYFVDNSFVLDERKLERGDILINSTGVGTAGRVTLFDLDGVFVVDSHITVLRPNKEVVLPDFILQSLVKIGFKNIEAMAMGQSGQIELTLPIIQNIKIPLPPKEIQEKIVSEIDILEKKENEAKEKIESLRKNMDKLLEKQSTEKYKIGDVLTLEYGAALPESNRIKGGFPVVGSNGIVGYHNEFSVESPSVIVGRKGSAGKITYINKNCFPIDTAFYVKLIDNQYNLKLIYYALQKADLENLSGGTGVPGLNRNDAYSKNILLPPLPEQQKIVAEIEKMEAQITEAQKIIDDMPMLKNDILKKYL